MASVAEGRLAIDLAHALVPLTGSVRGDETLLRVVGDADVVLVGDSTHGTHEFYRARAEITKRLISDKSFTAVCIEGAWPDACRVDRYVRGTSDDAEALDSLGGFNRFPAWLWRNADVLEFVAWLREYNGAAPAMGRPKAGFYGLDPYGTFSSSNPHTGENPVWRDAHVLETLEHLVNDLTVGQGPTKIVVWAHNTHVAFARRQLGNRAVAIGCTTYSGTVTAASRWDAPAECKHLVPARGDSYEYLFHATNVPRFLLPLRSHRPKLAGLPQQARERAIGVLYHPETELSGHYFTARLIEQFDAVYHFDLTHALEPLEGNSVEASPRSPYRLTNAGRSDG